MSARILVVDDTRTDRQIVTRALEHSGYAVETAEDGQQALERLRGAGGPDIDVVLLDVVMPVMDGFDTLAALRSEGILRHVPVIVVSAVGDVDSIARCIELGATDYLHKPYEARILAARLRACLADKRLREVELDHLAQVDLLTAAAASIEQGTYEPEQLDPVAARDDELGVLGRTFRHMVREVHSRERRLRRELEALRIEIDHDRRSRQVAEVTGSAYYRRLTGQAAVLRRMLDDDPEDPDDR